MLCPVYLQTWSPGPSTSSATGSALPSPSRSRSWLLLPRWWSGRTWSAWRSPASQNVTWPGAPDWLFGGGEGSWPWAGVVIAAVDGRVNTKSARWAYQCYQPSGIVPETSGILARFFQVQVRFRLGLRKKTTRFQKKHVEVRKPPEFQD